MHINNVNQIIYLNAVYPKKKSKTIDTFKLDNHHTNLFSKFLLTPCMDTS